MFQVEVNFKFKQKYQQYGPFFQIIFPFLMIMFQLISVNQKLAESEAVVQRCSVKKVFLEISQNSQENTVPESLF